MTADWSVKAECPKGETGSCSMSPEPLGSVDVIEPMPRLKLKVFTLSLSLSVAAVVAGPIFYFYFFCVLHLSLSFTADSLAAKTSSNQLKISRQWEGGSWSRDTHCAAQWDHR